MKRISILSLVALCCAGIFTGVFTSINMKTAAGMQVVVEQDKNEVQAGENLNLTMRFENYEEINQGVYAYKATLDYNRDLFEKVQQDDFQSLNGWERLRFNAETGELVAIKRAGSTQAEAVLSLSMKAAQNIQPGKEVVKLSDVVMSQGGADIAGGTADAVVDIVQKPIDKPEQNPEQTPEENPGQDPEQNPEQTQGQITEQGSEQQTSSIPGTSTDGEVSEAEDKIFTDSGDNRSEEVSSMTESAPQESLPDEKITNGTLWYGLAAAGTVVAALVAFVIRKSTKNKGDKNSGKGGKTFMILLILGVMAAQIATIAMPVMTANAATNGVKGELNGDGELDYQDVELLQQHLIHATELTGQAAEHADMNSDGQLTVTDLALLVQEIEKPRAEILAMETENVYVEKQATIQIQMQVKTNKPEDVRKIRINEQVYTADKVGNDRYEVTYTLGETSGLQELSATGVQFADGTEVPVNKSIRVEVLKSLPVVENFAYREVPNDVIEVRFDLTDADDALKNGQIILTDEKGNSVKTQSLQKGKNTLTFDKQSAGVYLMQIQASYDLDSDVLEAGKNEYQDQVLLEKEIVVSQETPRAEILSMEAETVYAKKQAALKIQVQLETNKQADVEKIRINEQICTANKVGDNRYEVTYTLGETSGLQELSATSVQFADGMEVPVNKSIQVEVLKSLPVVENFVYSEASDDRVEVRFDLTDADGALKNGQIVLTDEESNSVATQALQKGQNTLTFHKQSAEVYLMQVQASYDLDSDALGSGQNEYQDQVLSEEEIFVSSDRKIQAKDVLRVTAYRLNNSNQQEEVSSLSLTYLQYEYFRERYFVHVQMRDLPDFYAKIKGYRVENNQLYLELVDENTIQYAGGQANKLEVLYGDMIDANEAVGGESFEALVARIKANSDGTIKLTRDYDATGYNADLNAMTGQGFKFRGTLDGNGHTIYNMNGPLFDEVQGATIKNLKIANVSISNRPSLEVGDLPTSRRAAVANVVYSGTTIQNVHVTGLDILTADGASPYYGGLVGRTQGGTSTIYIDGCSVTGLNIRPSGASGSAGSQVGGIVGLSQDTVITNCYVEGSLQGNTAIGGIIGEINSGQDSTMKNEIRNCITKVDLSTNNGGGGGILGQASSIVTLADNISLSTGTNGFRLYAWGSVKCEGTNIAISESTLKENNVDTVQNIEKQSFSANTMRQLNFDETVWKTEGCSYDQLPCLKNGDPRNVEEGQQDPAAHYIPDYESLRQRPGYDAKKDLLYSNLYQLMPFYDAKYLVVDGRKLSADHLLNQKVIQSIVAFDDQKQVMTYLTEESYDKIQMIRLLFTDGTTQDYAVSYKYAGTNEPRKMYRRVAMYKIDDLSVEYNYRGYVIKQDSPLIDTLAQYIQNMDYDRDINGLENLNVWNRRGYGVLKAHFNQNIKTPEFARRLALNLAGNVDGYSITQENALLTFIINKKVENQTQFNRMMYAYTYYDRLYGVKMGGTSISELMMFLPETYNRDLSFERITNEFWNMEQKSIHVQNLQFSRYLAPALKISSSGELVERAMALTTFYSSADDWFTDYFSGRNLLTESQAKDHPEADYRAWTQLSKQAKFVMPILTLPEKTAFLVSAPGTFLVGSQMVYIDDVNDATKQQQLLNRMQAHGAKIANFYNNVLGIIDVSYLNKFADIQMDNYSVKVYGAQQSGQCTDPYHINFNDILNEWFDMKGALAYAYEGVIKYSYPAFNHYNEWTHEIGHNQSYKLFFKENGFRPIDGNNNGTLGTEDYTDGHTTQSFGDGDVQWNLNTDFTPDRLVTSNLTQDRINSVENLDSYYKGMYEAIDFLDYIEALAFLKLTPEEQSKVAVQIQYPNLNDRRAVTWKKLTAQEFEDMNLQSVADLWKHQITIRPGVNGSLTKYGDGEYGSEGMYIRRWYQPYNDKGRTHSWGFTYTTWQMLGIGGYENGYLTWFTGKSKNDLDAIQKITNDETMTWEKFKASRYQLMEESRNKIAYLDSDALVAQYVDALKTDAVNQDHNVTASTNVRRINYHYLKRVTNDFRGEVLGGNDEVIHIASADEFVEKLTKNLMGENAGYYIGSYVLDCDIDLSGVAAAGDALIDGYFMGRLDGNGHKITGTTAPVFSNLKFAHISNLTIENSSIQLPTRAEQTGVLSNTVEYATLENIVMQNTSVSANKEAGTLAGRLTGAIVQNVHVTDAAVSGIARVGTFAGYIDKSQITECSANGESSGTASAIGGFAGEIVGGTLVKDSYAVGIAKGGSGSDDVGGFVGYLNASRIENCFSNARAEGRNGVGGFIGQSIGNAVVKNSLALANQFKGYKFDGRTKQELFTNFSNNYERGAAVGASTLDRSGIDFDGKIGVAEETALQTEQFYTETLGWDSQVWDFNTVTAGGVPKLKNSDRNDSSSILETQRIRTADEFVEKINQNRYARFILEEDIDLSGKTELVKAEFYGILEGNNHTITGNQVPLFQATNQAVIRNLVLSKSQIKGEAEDTGSLVGRAVNTTIENVHVSDALVQGGNRTGGLAGSLENSKVARSSSHAVVSANGDETGGLAGSLVGGSVENCYATGNVQGNNSVGGLAGVASGAVIRFSYSAASVNGVQKVAGFVGQVTGDTTLENNIALGNQSNQYKFDGGTETSQLSKYSNNFEYEGNRGVSNLSRTDVDYTDKLRLAGYQQITSSDFYTGTLGWDADIWDFSKIADETAPTLKGLDTKEAQFVGVYRAEIKTVDEFLTELSAHPTGEFTITRDLDFAGQEYSVGTVLIHGTFMGLIKGEGNTIQNLKNATIFQQFNGEVQDLNIDTYSYGAAYWEDPYSQYVKPAQSDRTQSEVAVFAKYSMNARYTNMKLDRITIFGANRVAGLVAVDAYSTFDRIDVQHIYVSAGTSEATGNQSALLVGEKTGGSIVNCYVHGDLVTEGVQCGGIVGSARGEVMIDHVIANVYAANRNRKNSPSVGMFVGEVDAGTVIKNSASLGTTSAATSAKLIGKFYGTAADATAFQNCYENSTTTGTGKADGTNLLTVDMEKLKEVSFYLDTLGMDAAIWNLDAITVKRYTESVNLYGPNVEDAPEMIFLSLR